MDSNIQINSKQPRYKITQYTLNTRNTIQSTHERMPTRSKKTRQQCALPPGPALDLGSSFLTLTVVVTLALGTSSPRPGRTPLLCSLRLSSVQGPPSNYRRHLVFTKTDIHATKACSSYRHTYICSLQLLT